MTRALLALIIAIHAAATLIVTLRSRRQYLPMAKLLTPQQVFALRYGWALVAYDAVIALLVFA